MDLVLKNTRLPGRGDALADIAISSGEIAAIAPNITTVGPTVDAGGRLVSPGFIETHIHLDKSCILDRCRSERGDRGAVCQWRATGMIYPAGLVPSGEAHGRLMTFTRPTRPRRPGPYHR